MDQERTGRGRATNNDTARRAGWSRVNRRNTPGSRLPIPTDPSTHDVRRPEGRR